jgi:predicted protein tyrosine phosphatase
MSEVKAPRLLVVDRESLEAGLSVGARYVVVSIRDAQARKARVPPLPGLVDVLHVAFDDAEPLPGIPTPSRVRLMRPEDARAIHEFVERYRSAVGAVVVQCRGGVSRSPAVAAALARLWGADAMPFWRDACPNHFVHDLMLRSARVQEMEGRP